jgi:hypothetical protein
MICKEAGRELFLGPASIFVGQMIALDYGLWVTLVGNNDC